MERLSRVTLLWAACACSLWVQAQESGFPGRNVNVVGPPPAEFPFALPDNGLRQQNEPSCAVNPENPLQVCCGFNDYRGIDIPELGDAWQGLACSRDGGGSWNSQLIAGSRADAEFSLNLEFAADPNLVAAPGGLFFNYIAADRNQVGGLYMQRYAWRNKEDGWPLLQVGGPVLVAKGTSGRFIDKPHMLGFLNDNSSATVAMTWSNAEGPQSRTLPAGNLGVAAAVFVGNDNNDGTKILYWNSSDWGATWDQPTKLTESKGVNSGINLAANGDDVCAVWRRFDDTNETNSILYACSSDRGQRFTKPQELHVDMCPFDLTTLDGSVGFGDIFPVAFRSNAFPVIAADGEDFYVFWSDRGYAAASGGAAGCEPLLDDGTGNLSYNPNGSFGRIVYKSIRKNGRKWATSPNPVPVEDVDAGHQFMPAAYGANGEIVVSWLDSRDDITAQYGLDLPVDRVFIWDFWQGSDAIYRHTLDVRGARMRGGALAPSNKVSRYRRGLFPGPGGLSLRDLEFNLPNARMFKSGRAPFLGDYLTVTAPLASKDANGNWKNSNTAPRPGSATFHIGWGDNRDVRGSAWGSSPGFADASPYSPTGAAFSDGSPNSEGEQSNLSLGVEDDPEPSPPSCEAVQADRTRDQNVYATPFYPAATLQAPGAIKLSNTGAASAPLRRAMPVVIQNRTELPRWFRLEVIPAPGVSASFRQFEPQATTQLRVFGKSSAVRTVFVLSGDALPAVEVRALSCSGRNSGCDTVVASIDLNNDPLEFGGNLEQPGFGGSSIFAQELHNPNLLNPALLNPDLLYVLWTNPELLNTLFNSDQPLAQTDLINPDLLSAQLAAAIEADPTILNIDLISPNTLFTLLANPELLNPNLLVEDPANPTILNPTILNDGLLNAALWDLVVANPTIFNPTILNSGFIDDLTNNPEALQADSGPRGVLYDTVLAQPDVLNPSVLNILVENPTVLNTLVENPTILNAVAANPTILNTLASNPALANPTVLNPTVLNPTVLNTLLDNYDLLNPTVLNPTVLNPTVLNQALVDLSATEAALQDESGAPNLEIINAVVANPTILNPTLLATLVANPTILNPTLFNSLVANPTILNPTVLNPTILNPTLFNPTILNAALSNPDLVNPDLLNAVLLNPTVLNPSVLNPTVLNPTLLNPTLFNSTLRDSILEDPDLLNPDLVDPDLLNPTIFNATVSYQELENPDAASAVSSDGGGLGDDSYIDVTWQVRNDGNTTTGYIAQPYIAGPTDDYTGSQLIVSKPYLRQTTRNCKPVLESTNNVVVNIPNPPNREPIANVESASQEAEELASFWLAPGEVANVTFRVFASDGSQLFADRLGLYVSSEACNTGSACDAKPFVSTVRAFDQTPPVFEEGFPTLISGGEAVGPEGAVVIFQEPSATDEGDGGEVPVECVFASGSTFPVGTSDHSCTATDSAGNSASLDFQVAVEDSTAPTVVITPPAGFALPLEATGPGGAAIDFSDWSISATDLVDTTVQPVCSRNDGLALDALFPIAASGTLLSCNATDFSGNTSADATLNIVVQDSTPPLVTVPGFTVTAEATSAAGATVTFLAGASDLVDPDPVLFCRDGAGSPLTSGSLFPLGDTTVSCTASDAFGNTSAPSLFTVRVSDSVAPILSVPPVVIAEASSPAGAEVSWSASAVDTVDGSPAVGCAPAPGLFSIGTTLVTCTATDASGNTTALSFNVTVADTVAPALTLPAPITLEAAAPDGNIVTYSVTGSDAADSTPDINCAPTSGSRFAIGTTTVNCSINDDAGNSSSGSFTVSIVDTTAPVLTLPADISVAAVDASGAFVDYIVAATDTASDSVAIDCQPASGSLFPIGNTQVACTATDAQGLQTSGSFSVSVEVDIVWIMPLDDPHFDSIGPNLNLRWGYGVINDLFDSSNFIATQSGKGTQPIVISYLGDTSCSMAAPRVVDLDAGKSSLRYSSGEWQLNWQTGQSILEGGPLVPGCYLLEIPRVNGTVDTKRIILSN